MTVSQEVADMTPNHDWAPVDPDAGFSFRERWQISGNTLPAKIVNNLGRFAHRRFTLDSETTPCAEYFASKPTRVRERLPWIAARLRPASIYLEFEGLLNEVENNAKLPFEKLPEDIASVAGD